MITLKGKNRRNERGSLMIEAALMLPVVSLLMMGVVEFGQVLMIKQAITNAARESARVAALDMDNTEALNSAATVAQDYLERSGLDLSCVTVSPTFSQVNGMDAVAVNIGYDYASNLCSWIPGIPQTLGLHSQVTMRREA